jgi:ParB family chromosome partitioning protein
MNLRDVAREFRELPLAILDRPLLDARIKRDEAQLEELAGDIARRGVILPLAVVRTDDRYEVVDGFCRYIAATRAGLVTVPCVIYPSKDVALEGVKYAANLFRQEMSPAEEAVFFNELLTHECGGDIEQLCSLVNKKLSYVDSRLALLNGDEDVFEAVRAGVLKLGVAAELNKIPAEDYRRYYLRLAVRDGATVAMVSGWVSEWHKLYGERPPAATPAPASSGQAVSQPLDIHYCEVCRTSDPRYIPEQISVHTHCKLAVFEKLIDAYHGGN